MADYLCDHNYEEIKEIPSNVDRDRALRNLELYLNLICNVTLQRSFYKSLHPEIASKPTYLSRGTLPYLLTEGAGTQTVLEFLTDSWEDILKENVEELEMTLVALVDLFFDDQLALAYKRLTDLYDRIEEGLDDV